MSRRGANLWKDRSAARPRRRTSPRTRWCLALAVLALWACPSRTPEGEPALETTDVDAPPTASLTAEGDPVERRQASQLTGVLPGDFPDDLPIYLPASVLDFGDLGGGDPEGGRRFVSLSTAAGIRQVEAELRRRLDGSGWQAVGDDPWRRRRGELEVVYQLSPGQAIGTVVRIEYPGG